MHLKQNGIICGPRVRRAGPIPARSQIRRLPLTSIPILRGKYNLFFGPCGGALYGPAKNALDKMRVCEYNNRRCGCLQTDFPQHIESGDDMNGYMSAKDAAARWDVSERQVQKLCKEGRIAGVTLFADAWAIPEDAPKPTRTGKAKPGPKPKHRTADVPGGQR
jgi:hypothetical protein